MSLTTSLAALRKQLPDFTLQVLDDLDAMVYVKDLDGHYLWANRMFLEAVRRTSDNILGALDSDFADAATVQVFREEDERIQQTRDVLRARREVVLRETGERRVYQAVKRPVFDAHGDVVAIAGVSTDVTYETRTERRLHTLLTLSADWYWEQDAKGRFTAFSSLSDSGPLQALQRQSYGRRRWEVEGLQPLNGDWSDHQRAYTQAQAFRDFEYARLFPDGREVVIAVSGEPLYSHEGELIGWRGVGRDVTAAVQQRRALQNAESARRSTLLAIPDLLYEFDAQGRYVHMQAPAEVSHIVLNYQSIGKRLEDVLPVAVAKTYRNAMARAARLGVARRVEYSLELPDGVHWFEDSISARRDPVSGELAGYVALVRDVTEARRARTALEEQLHHDPLTGLPTQYAMLQTLESLLDSPNGGSERGSPGFVFCKIEPADFRLLVTRCGHKVADELLRLIADRLRRSTWQEVRWARAAPGSSFLALALPGAAVLDQGVERWIERLSALLKPVFELSIGPLTVHFDLGLFVVGRSGDAGHAEDVLRATELALDEARSQFKRDAVIYEPERGHRILQALQLKTELAAAVSQNQLRLHWQAIVDAEGVELAREALVRWQHPQRGLLGPVEFVALAEETDLILNLGQWVLTSALLERKRWVDAQSSAQPVPVINVNVSARQVQQTDFAQQVRALLREHDCPPEALQLEITEGLLMQDSAVILNQLRELRELGVGIALDDFGTGFSCLSYLQRLPLSCLKIDRSFVSQLLHDSGTEAVVRTIIALAEGLQLSVVAEGVETESQRHALLALGVQRFQGYLFGKPRACSGRMD